MRRRGLVGVLLLVVVLLVAGIGFAVGTWNPFRDPAADSSGPVLLQSIRNLQRYVPAQGVFEVAIVLEQGVEYVPTFVFGYEGVLVAHGTVDAYVDFAGVTEDALDVSADRRTVTLRLPAPQLAPPAVDHARSQVVVDDGGIVNDLGALFGNDESLVQELYRAADGRIAAAAAASDLRARAEENTRAMLRSVGTSLGFETVEVTFEPSPA